jgi:60 kDa SS-A/Ro ribonucleoprotein
MSKFNTTVTKSKTLTENLAGGQAYGQSNELAFVSMLLTSFVNDQFYKGSNDTLKDLKTLSEKIKDKEFVAKAAIYARDKFGMRSITHALAGELTSQLTGFDWAKNFYDKVVVRPDDMTEILSYYLANKTDKSKPKFPNALKKGFATAFDKFDGYQISKYKMENKEVKLVDVVNLVHPTPTEKNGEALNLLINDKVKNTQTWEAKLSAVGQVAEGEEDLAQLKSDAWDELISTRKIGLMAMLKNLRNIIKDSPKSIPLVCESLKNEKFITNSKVLPFRFSTAYEEISKLGSSKEVRDVLVAINQSLEVSLVNVPKFDGETLVVMDVSGSMGGRPSEIASLFGAILAKVNNADVITFSTSAQYKSYNPMDSVMTIRDSFRFSGGGTNFKSIFTTANKKYDRVVLLSDMQGWMGYTTPSAEFNQYKKRFGANPFVYSWDLAGHSTMQFPEQNVFGLAGFSDKVFDIMKLMEVDKNALFNEIKAVQL